MLQAVAARSKDPAASLACFFSRLSKRNGEILSLRASRVMNQQLQQAIKLTIEVTRSEWRETVADMAFDHHRNLEDFLQQ